MVMVKNEGNRGEAIATVATTVGVVLFLSSTRWPFAMRQDFAIDGGLNGVCHKSRDVQKRT